MKQYVRAIPPIHEIKKDKQFEQLMETFGIGEKELTNVAKEAVNDIRQKILNDAWAGPTPGDQTFVSTIFQLMEEMLKKTFEYTLKRVINGTGTIIHTNLGRARLSKRAVEHVVEAAQSYTNLEYKLEEGTRGSRYSHVEKLIQEITGAEAAMVVNNNAAAVYLILRELAKEKEVIVSRGELVEIGGSFRISSIMEESGAKLVEVGTTNKTHLYDYESALSEETAIIMKVHTSNFRVIGFTESVPREDLARLAQENEDIIFYEDLGSGALFDFNQFDIGDEPVVAQVLETGVDVVSFSGDKLLGGPQAGIIAGKKEIIDRLKKNQLARVVRVDKMTLAALEGTLSAYLKGEKGLKEIPVARDLLWTKEQLLERTKSFNDRLASKTDVFHLSIKDSFSQVGGGTMPEVELPTVVSALKHQTLSPEQVARRLRTDFDPAVVVRIQKEEIYIDLRTVSEEEEEIVVNALANI